jgi:AraC-like DNA-binding protein
VIASSGKDKGIPDKAIEKSGFTYTELNGEKVVIVSAKSQVIDWTYNIIIPQYVFFQKVTGLKNVFIFMELIAVIIGILISGFFTYRNYIPIKEIMEAILKKYGGAGEIGNVHTEYEYIKSSILSSIDETNSLKSAIEGYKSMLKINLLVRLIKGEVQDREFNGGIFGSLDIHLNFPAFAVMILQTPENGTASDNADTDMKKTIENHLNQIPQKPVKSYTIELEPGKYIMILCFSVLSEEEIIQYISEFTGFLEKIYMNRAEDDVRIAVGRLVYDPRQIFNSFRDADREQTQKYDYQEGNEAQVTKSSLSEQIYYYSMDMEVQLSNMARSGNIEDVTGMLEKIYERNFVSLSLSTQMARFLFVAVLNTAFSIIYEMQIELRYNPMEAVMTANKADDMYHTIQMIFTDICRLVKEKEKTIKDNEKRNIIVFIQENLYNMNLSLTLIADEFHMTPSGVYRIIKEQTGEGFVDLVNKYRLCQAKHLLESTNLLVAEIAQKSGYQSDNSFIRAFKKYTGITPGQYREMSIKSTNRSLD